MNLNSKFKVSSICGIQFTLKKTKPIYRHWLNIRKWDEAYELMDIVRFTQLVVQIKNIYFMGCDRFPSTNANAFADVLLMYIVRKETQ